MSRQHYASERLYVGNLPYDVTEREVDDLFYKFGRIRDIEVKRSRKNDTSFAFVVFDDKYSVDDAIERRDGMRYGDMCLRVERGGERRGGRGGGDGGSYGPPRRSAFRVRVHGLPPTASWQDLKDHMRKAGDVGFASVENRVRLKNRETFLKLFWIRDAVEKPDAAGCRELFGKGPYVAQAPGTWAVGIVEYPSREEMEYAIKRLDRSEFCNIFHRAQIRVERDYGSAGEEEYDRVDRRSRSYSERRNRSRSARRDASHAEHESSSRRQRDCPDSREGSRVNAHSDIEQCPSVRSEKVDTADSRDTHESHTRPNSRSASNSPRGSCATEPHGQGDSQTGEQKRPSEPAGRLRSASGSPPSRRTDESHPVSAVEA
ncbi:splicing factor, putative [Eimeria brunetti]|uniref:Splicing factor, putative n=1 Tax=Eimeria brunetti TaxID=51314 RepID=U6LYK0_9EIME|nr:splicing factor, putative [Eimeria brunetti]